MTLVSSFYHGIEKEDSENEKIFDDRHSWTKGRGDVTISGNVGSSAGRILAALEHGHKHPPPRRLVLRALEAGECLSAFKKTEDQKGNEIMAALTISKEEEKRLKGLGFLNNKGTDNFSARVITVNGKVNTAQMTCLTEAAEKYGNGNMAFTTRLTVEVQGIPYENIEAFQAYIAKAGLQTGGTGAKVRPIVSCKGTTCQYGLLDSFALSEEIHHRFYEGYHDVALPHKFKIAVGGCPNNCVKPDLNDLGIIGQRIPNFDKSRCKGCKKCSVAAACPIGASKVVDGIASPR